MAYKKIIQQYPLITQKDSDLCFKYKQKYVVLKGQEVFYINNKEGLPLSKYIKYYQFLIFYYCIYRFFSISYAKK